MRSLTRRGILKPGGAATLGLALRLPPEEDNLSSQTPKGLGPVTRALQAYDQPFFSGKKIRVYGVDTILNIYEEKPAIRKRRTTHLVPRGRRLGSLVAPAIELGRKKEHHVYHFCNFRT